MKYDTNKHTGCRLLLLAAIVAMSAVLVPAVAVAEERSEGDLKNRQAISRPSGEMIFINDEIYGLSRLADAADKYRPAVADPSCLKEVSFIVAGEVRSPGEYSLPAPISLLSALLAAGGPTASGSMRHVQVFHDGSLLGEYDLYGFINEGRIVDDFIFNGGEHIVVMPHGARVSVSGSVATPAVFELKPEEMNLGRLFDLCGGFARSRNTHRVEVVRIEAGSRNLAFSANVRSGLPDFRLQAGDRVNVYEVTGGRPLASVQLPDGSVRDFSLQRVSRISHLLKEVQPLLDNVASGYAELLREGRPDRKFEVVGILWLDLLQMMAAGDMSQDLILRPGDRLVFFERNFIEKKPVVGLEVSGQSPVFTDYRAGMKISDLLQAADVELPHQLGRARVNRRKLHGARLESIGIMINLSAARRGDELHNIELQPFDSMVIQP